MLSAAVAILALGAPGRPARAGSGLALLILASSALVG
jgi:hypothetical protein